jgi:hypothetical protein
MAIKELKYISTKDGLTFKLGDKIKTVFKEDPIYESCLQLIKSNNGKGLKNKLFPVKEVAKKYSDYISQKNGKFYLKGEKEPVPRALGIKIMEFSKEGEDLKPLINFWNRLKRNPSQVSREELYLFLEKNHHPITEEGNFIAYKKVEVRRDTSSRNTDFYGQTEVDSFISNGTIDSKKWVDHYSGKFINNKGKIVKMNRDLVDPNRSTSCSVGLHVAAFSYAHSFSGTIMIEVLVDPKDVVSVPFDECDTKMRVCQYRIIDRYKDNKEIKKSVVKEKKYKETSLTPKQNSKFKTEAQLKELKAREIFEYCKQIKLEIKETPSLLKSKASLIKKVLKLQSEHK